VLKRSTERHSGLCWLQTAERKASAAARFARADHLADFRRQAFPLILRQAPRSVLIDINRTIMQGLSPSQRPLPLRDTDFDSIG
jgi:hypothetical protein